MRVGFEATLDDVMDVQLRCLAPSATHRGLVRAGAIATGFLTGLVLAWIAPEDIEIKLLIGAGGFLAAVALFLFLYPRILNRALRRYCREATGGAESFEVQVELRTDGVWVKQLGNEVVVPWVNVRGIEEREDSIELLARPAGMTAVRKRAFSSAGQMIEFMQLASAPLGQPLLGPDKAPGA
jgi:hypothetical protein